MRATALAVRVVSLGVLLLLASFVLMEAPQSPSFTGGVITFSLGFVLLFGYYLAKLLGGAGLPFISGYILVGVLCGPFVLNVLSFDVVHKMQRLEDMALSIIALIAGGELRLAAMRTKARDYAVVILAQVVVMLLCCVGAVLLLAGHLPFLAGEPVQIVVVAGVLLGLAMVARSPASLVGVVAELRARGPLTELLVGVTMLIDVVVLVLCSLLIPAAEAYVSDLPLSFAFAKTLVVELAAAGVVGMALGLLLRVYIGRIGGYLPLVLLTLGLVGSAACREFHIEPLLPFMIAGFYVENFSRHGDRLIRALERSAFPVYVLFFAVSGASIDIGALRASWLLALVLVVVRAGSFFGASILVSPVAPSLRPFARSVWQGFLPQAGVTIGVAGIIGRHFSFGPALESVILAIVAINQLAGPVALKALLVRAGETNMRRLRR